MATTDTFFNNQLQSWPQAAEAFKALEKCRRRIVALPYSDTSANVTILYNPARIRSTGANVSAKAINRRPCFLCPANRPKEQFTDNSLLDLGYEMLVNPYPILNPHFTIVSIRHEPQIMPVATMMEAARRYPSLTFFFNGANSGASAPDHLHFQAVNIADIPLLRQAEQAHRQNGRFSSINLGIQHPATFYSYLDVAPYDIKVPAANLINSFIWQRIDGRLQCILFPRKAHRAPSYPEPMVSPGALDVSGLMVTVREIDFLNLSPQTISSIYTNTCYSPYDPLP